MRAHVIRGRWLYAQDQWPQSAPSAPVCCKTHYWYYTHFVTKCHTTVLRILVACLYLSCVVAHCFIPLCAWGGWWRSAHQLQFRPLARLCYQVFCLNNVALFFRASPRTMLALVMVCVARTMFVFLRTLILVCTSGWLPISVHCQII